MQKLRQTPHVQAVYDMTIAYAENDQLFLSPPTFWQTLSEPRLDQHWRFFVHVERHELRSLPQASEDLATWLEDRWIEKGQRLEHLRSQLLQGLPWEGDGADAATKRD